MKDFLNKYKKIIFFYSIIPVFFVNVFFYIYSSKRNSETFIVYGSISTCDNGELPNGLMIINAKRYNISPSGSFYLNNVSFGEKEITFIFNGFLVKRMKIFVEKDRFLKVELNPLIVSGVVVDNFKNVADAYVSIGKKTVKTNESGFYVFKKISNFNDSITVKRKGYRTYYSKINLTKQSVYNINLTPFLLEFSGVIQNNDRGICNAKLTLNDNVTYSSALGFFVFNNLKPGNYNFCIEKDGYKKYRKFIKLINNSTRNINLPSLKYSFSGTVNSNKKSICEAQIIIDDVIKYTNSLGYFIFNDVLPGLHKIKIKRKGFRYFAKAINIKEDTNINFEIEPVKYSLSGTVLSKDGYIKDAKIKIGGNTIYTDSQGYFAVFGLNKHIYRILIKKQGFYEYYKTIEVFNDSFKKFHLRQIS